MALPDGASPSPSPLDRIARPQRVPIRTLWPTEEHHFTPWLAKSLDFLDVLELGPLQALSVEANLPGGGMSLDLLAETAEGIRVAIENQFLRSNHDHLTRGLAYAVGLDAALLVVVAEEHRGEIVAVADYLNRLVSAAGDQGGIGVFLVEVSVEELEGRYIPRFQVLSRPLHGTPETSSHARVHITQEELLALAPEAQRGAIEQMLATWSRIPGSTVTFASKSAALYVANARKANGRTCALSVQVSGQLVVNRGYLERSGAFEEDHDLASLDRKISDCFPGLQYGPGLEFAALPETSTDSVESFGVWVAERLREVGGVGGPVVDPSPGRPLPSPIAPRAPEA